MKSSRERSGRGAVAELARVCLCVGTLFVLGCGEAESGPPGRRFVALERSGVEVEVGVEVVSVRLLPDAGETWKTDAQSRLGEVKHLGIERCLHVLGEGSRMVSVKGEFSPAAFNQVSVGYLCRMRSSLEVMLLRGGRRVAKSDRILVRVSTEPQLIVASFLGLDPDAEPIDEIQFYFPERAGPVGFLFAELSKVRVEAWMESRLVRGTHARVGSELRPAHWLTPGHPLVGRFTPQSGELLVVGVAAEELFGNPPEGSGVELSIDGGESLLKREHHDLSGSEGGWSEHGMSLAGFEGGEVEFTARLTGGGGRDLGVWVTEPRLETAHEDPPLVLLITSDTHRADHLATAMGSVHIETPTLDAFAARGVMFERAQSTSCITLPSHTSILTGIHPRDLGIVDNVTALKEEARTLQEVFAEEGWRTFAVVSALHLGHEVSGLSQGFERMSAPAFGAVAGEGSVELLLEWLDEFPDQPVFAWLHVFDAHAPYTAENFDAPYLEQARAASSDVPLNVRENRARYRGEVRYVDHHLKALLDHPRVRAGVVAFTADHGEALGDHGIYFTHEEVYPDTLRVPLIMAWPGCPQGARVGAPISNAGIGRSLLSAAGLGMREFPGVDLLPYAGEDSPGEAQPLFAFSYGAQAASMTWRDRHLILHLKGHGIGKKVPGSETSLWDSQDCQVEFFDLSIDPGCMNDLVEERHEEAARYRRLLIDWLLATEDRGWSGEGEVGEDVLSQLADLGYTGPSDGGGEGWWDPDPESEWYQRFEER